VDALHINRFAAFAADGSMTSLVAEGLPEWPTDGALGAIADADLYAMEQAYLAEFAAIEADPSRPVGDAVALAEHVRALRDEAERRMAAEPVPEPTAEELAAQAAADEAAAALAAEREAQLAALRAEITPEPGAGETIPEGTAFSREDLVAAVTAGAEAAARAIVPAVTAAIAQAAPVTEPAPGVTITRMRARDLGGYRPDHLAPAPANGAERSRFTAKVVSATDSSAVGLGGEIQTMDQLVDIFTEKALAIGRASGVDNEQVKLASIKLDRVPPEMDLRGITDGRELRRKVLSVIGPEAVGVNPWTGREAPIGRGGVVHVGEGLVASGGLAAPVEPYYNQLVIAQGARPVQAALPTFVAERGGIKLTLPPSIGTIAAATTPGQYTDGVTNTDTSLVSATATFTAADAGSYISGSPTIFAEGTIIASVTNSTTVVLSAATLTTTTGVTFVIQRRNPYNLGPAVGVVTAAQDAAGPPNVIKYTYDVPVGTQNEYDVYSVYTSLQFGNLTGRTFPEQVEANIRVADALAARTADTQMLNLISLYSTLFTGAKTFGTARQLLAQLGHMGAVYRNSERMDPSAVLRVLLPAWAINAMRGDYIASFIGGGDAWGLSDDEIAGWLADNHFMLSLYQDGPTDISQLFVTTGFSGATGNGTTLGTPIAIPDYPGTGATTSFRTQVISFMWAEGTWLGLTTGELNLGLVRDSILNSQNRYRQFSEVWETPAFVGTRTLRGEHTVAADGSYGAAVSVTLGAGNGL